MATMPLILAALLSTVVLVSAFNVQINITAGQNITLPCRAPNDNKIIIVMEWSRPDLQTEYVLCYRDEQFDPDYQHPSFKNRVDLQDRQMKDGDVSLILYNVTINDAGTYECRVIQNETSRRKRAHLDVDPISIIYLSVVDPPGQTGGDTEDGGKEDGGKKSGSVGLIVGLSVFAVLLVSAVSGFLIYRKYKKQAQDSYQPPV
ncbi:programmed cell death 1 ligand 1-like [Neolamprologus brichardi]|uniref:programmed cell death 1 ligand 1-like n=1 Tax=Neolamprologus brichardi TaxID=32507 RepID=UPI0003EBBAD9|nr:programmed cell death 1 ligand 1-like [Neolamprologus brichardi]